MTFLKLCNQVVETNGITLIGDVEVSIDREGSPVARYRNTEDVLRVTMFGGRKFNSAEELVHVFEADREAELV